jgi:hypothetical protein
MYRIQPGRFTVEAIGVTIRNIKHSPSIPEIIQFIIDNATKYQLPTIIMGCIVKNRYAAKNILNLFHDGDQINVKGIISNSSMILCITRIEKLTHGACNLVIDIPNRS